MVGEIWSKALEQIRRLGSLSDDALAILTNANQGTYTPTLTNVTNLDASTAYETGFHRIGDMVTVFGQFDADATAAGGTATELDISLPIASNFTAFSQLGGTAASRGVNSAAAIEADVANDRASVRWVSQDTVNRPFAFHFSYRVL